MKNEAPYILEWIAYHRMIGATDFTIFTNDCTDGTNLILNRLDQLGIVRHFDNPLGPRMDPQRRAYSRAGGMEKVRAADWVMIVDADEFVNIRAGDGTFADLIAACSSGGDPAAISIPWRIMGSSGEAHWRDAPVTTRFTAGSTFEAPENGLVWGFKTLFRPRVFDFFGVHRPKFRQTEVDPAEILWVNASGQDMGDRIVQKGWCFNASTIGWDHAQVNHYAIKSREEFLLKRLRGTANSKNKGRIDMGYWEKFDLNANEDRSIRTDALEREIASLLEDEALKALRDAAIETCRRTIDAQMQDEALRRFVETGIYSEEDGDTGDAPFGERPHPAPALHPAGTPRLLCIGAHHKSGTNWLRRALHAIRRDQDLPLHHIGSPRAMRKLEGTGTALAVNWSSSFPEALLNDPEARFIHIVRDPRNVLLAGMAYHLIAPEGAHTWLDEPQGALAGSTYRDHLSALPDNEARLLFEMEGRHAETVKEMLAWPSGHPGAVQLRYEDILADTDGTLLRGALETCGVAGLDIDRAVEQIRAHGPLGEAIPSPGREAEQAEQERRDAAANWQSDLPRPVAVSYAARWGDALKRLGYADDDTWLDELAPPAPARRSGAR
ncbi:glycosyltransferase family 2 protein [Tropicimonas sp. IMCC34011]|uniref:glycosyltransferase family 2 protein n=1 Tax=Tropicimonas sp. IMCC34011 TaxID=2248759 RepID=UPI000E22076B|nr:glycosyltransferase family 2 protein [Tropicimonas sp. IMCC34011]